MEKEFVPYELALELKELGFDKPCIKGFYEKQELFTVVSTPVDFNNKEQLGELVSAPLYQQAFRFFRVKYNILANVYSNASGFLYEWHDTIGGTHRGDSGYDGINESGCWDSYEEAELACLRKLIEIVKATK